MKSQEVLSKSDVVKVFDYLESVFGGNEETELAYFNVYQLLVAVMLSAQMTDKGVNRVSKKLFSVIKDPSDALKIGVEKINEIIKSVNYHNVKSKHIVEMSQQLVEKYNSKVPNNFEDLIKLKGVGRKTANLVLSIAFKQDRIAVDTHCFRVANRLGLVNAKTPAETERQLTINVPKKMHRKINSLLISLGRQHCKAIKPKCNECGLRNICKFYKKQNSDEKQKQKNTATSIDKN